jgi:hypothetical protein
LPYVRVAGLLVLVSSPRYWSSEKLERRGRDISRPCDSEVDCATISNAGM